MTIASQMNRGYDSNTVAVRNEGIPIVLITTQEESDDDEYDVELSEVLPLPASKYRYTKWHEIEDVNLSSSALKAPRVRRAPLSYKKDTIYAIEEEYADNSDVDIESGKVSKKKFKKLRSKKRQDYRNKLEDWPNCNFVNLSYQELGHGYQLKEFYKVLRKLLRCQEIELMENSLADLHTISFPSCTRLYLQRNFLSSFKKLPIIPNVEHLSLQQNNISSFNGLEIFKRSRLKSLILEGNPLSLEKYYRQRSASFSAEQTKLLSAKIERNLVRITATQSRVFKILPDLKLLDGLPKTSLDEQMTKDTEPEVGSCIIS